MKVQQLIDALQLHPPSLEIVVDGEGDDVSEVTCERVVDPKDTSRTMPAIILQLEWKEVPGG